MMTAFTGEIIGTMVLILLGCGTNAGGALSKSYANGNGWLIGTIGWGLAVTMGVYAAGQISGAHLNPAVTIALAAIGAFPWADVPSYILAQMIGAFIGATLVWVHYLPHWKTTPDPATKLGVFSTSPAIRSNWPNLVSEMLGTFALLFGLLFIGLNEFTEGLNPIAVGFLITLIGISLGGTTGYAINPARDLAPRIAHFVLPIHGKGDSNWGYAAIPIIGPIVGGILGASVYQLLFDGKVSYWLWGSVAVFGLVLVLAIASASKAEE